MKPIFYSLVIFLIGQLLISCSTNSPKESGTPGVLLCTDEHCVATSDQTQLFSNLEQLLKLNEGIQVPICSADPTTRNCRKSKVCHFVLGGILPGNGCSTSLTFSQLTKDEQNIQLSMQTYMPLTFIGTEVKCTQAPSTLIITESSSIKLHLKSHYCNWKVMGNMMAELDFIFESINFERGEVTGYWRHSVVGTGIGSGSGYMKLRFPKGIAQTATAQVVTRPSP